MAKPPVYTVQAQEEVKSVKKKLLHWGQPTIHTYFCYPDGSD